MTYNPEADGAKTDFQSDMSYGDYLKIDTLTALQNCKSTAHDEMLFIIQHQTSELWMRLIVHELNAARAAIASDHTEAAFKMLTRVARIFEQLNSAWDVLRTMTPSEYTEFRDSLGRSSGFQSHQYRMIEFILGNRNSHMIKPHAHLPEIKRALEDELLVPSLYDLAIGQLAKAGFDVTVKKVEAEALDPRLLHAWKAVYQAPSDYWTLYQLAEKLVDIEDYFRRWRFNHVTTVERVIGFKKGSGGTSGVNYLKKMLDVVLYPELWALRSEL